jgi:hypothetical protein
MRDSLKRVEVVAVFIWVAGEGWRVERKALPLLPAPRTFQGLASANKAVIIWQ